MSKIPIITIFLFLSVFALNDETHMIILYGMIAFVVSVVVHSIKGKTEMKSQDNDKPYTDGLVAFENGMPRYHYPCYKSNSDERSWIDGWDDAQRRSNENQSLKEWLR